MFKLLRLELYGKPQVSCSMLFFAMIIKFRLTSVDCWYAFSCTKEIDHFQNNFTLVYCFLNAYFFIKGQKVKFSNPFFIITFYPQVVLLCNKKNCRPSINWCATNLSFLHFVIVKIAGIFHYFFVLEFQPIFIVLYKHESPK